MYKIAVMGLSHWYWAYDLARDLAENTNVELVGVFSPNEDKRRKYSELFGVKAYNNYDELLANKELDMVLITPPVSGIAEYAVAAAKAGKHILLGKPMAMNLKEADEIVKAITESGVKAFPLDSVCKMYTSVKDLIKKGEIGNVVYLTSTTHTPIAEDWYRSGKPGWFADPQCVPGGAFVDHAIYAIQLSRFYANSEVKEINYAKIDNLVYKNIKVEDFGLALLTFKNGIIGRIEATWTIARKKTGLLPKINNGYTRHEIIGDKGEIILSDSPFNYQSTLGETHLNRSFVKSANATANANNVNSILNHLIECIEKNTEPIATVEDSRKALEIALAIYKSAKEGRPVSL